MKRTFSDVLVLAGALTIVVGVLAISGRALVAEAQITQLPIEGLKAHAEPLGRTVVIVFDRPVHSLRSNQIWRGQAVVDVPARKYTRIQNFLGVDQGNHGEFAIDVFADDGSRLYQRSMHKETTSNYEAWDRAPLTGDVRVRRLTIQLHGHLTGQGGPTGNVEFGVVLEGGS
jgi:hypothetical protein